jgi:hypothetical protein
MLYLPSNKDNMNKYEIEVLIEMLKKQLNETEKMWNDKENHAVIVGYLTGTVKGVISHLETKLK